MYFYCCCFCYRLYLELLIDTKPLPQKRMDFRRCQNCHSFDPVFLYQEIFEGSQTHLLYHIHMDSCQDIQTHKFNMIVHHVNKVVFIGSQKARIWLPSSEASRFTHGPLIPLFYFSREYKLNSLNIRNVLPFVHNTVLCYGLKYLSF